MNLYEKIVELMKKIQYLQKDDNVGTGNASYKAISEEKVTSEVRKAMIELGLVLLPVDVQDKTTTYQYTESFTDPKGNTKETVKFQRLCEVNTKYKLVNVEKPEEFEIIASMGHGIDPQDKSSGKALTYAYKYALLRSYAIPTGEDPDKVHSNEIEIPTTKTSPKASEKPASPVSTPKGTNTPEKVQNATEEQINSIKGLIEETGTDIGKFLSAYGINKYEDLTHVQAMDATIKLASKLKK